MTQVLDISNGDTINKKLEAKNNADGQMDRRQNPARQDC